MPNFVSGHFQLFNPRDIDKTPCYDTYIKSPYCFNESIKVLVRDRGGIANPHQMLADGEVVFLNGVAHGRNGDSDIGYWLVIEVDDHSQLEAIPNYTGVVGVASFTMSGVLHTTKDLSYPLVLDIVDHHGQLPSYSSHRFDLTGYRSSVIEAFKEGMRKDQKTLLSLAARYHSTNYDEEGRFFHVFYPSAITRLGRFSDEQPVVYPVQPLAIWGGEYYKDLYVHPSGPRTKPRTVAQAAGISKLGEKALTAKHPAKRLEEVGRQYAVDQLDPFAHAVADGRGSGEAYGDGIEGPELGDSTLTELSPQSSPVRSAQARVKGPQRGRDDGPPLPSRVVAKRARDESEDGDEQSNAPAGSLKRQKKV